MITFLAYALVLFDFDRVFCFHLYRPKPNVVPSANQPASHMHYQPSSQTSKPTHRHPVCLPTGGGCFTHVCQCGSFSFVFSMKVGLGESANNVWSTHTLGPIKAPSGPIWAYFGSILGPLGSILSPFGVHLGSRWGPFRARSGPMLRPNGLMFGPQMGP
jgi:hypothetical protein